MIRYSSIQRAKFYWQFQAVMKRRARLHVRRLRMIETKKATPKIMDDLEFMLYNNQRDLDQVLAGIGKFYLTEIL